MRPLALCSSLTEAVTSKWTLIRWCQIENAVSFRPAGNCLCGVPGVWSCRWLERRRRRKEDSLWDPPKRCICHYFHVV